MKVGFSKSVLIVMYLLVISWGSTKAQSLDTAKIKIDF
jgi:hypothetical protein